MIVILINQERNRIVNVSLRGCLFKSFKQLNKEHDDINNILIKFEIKTRVGLALYGKYTIRHFTG